ncbi:MAG: sulfite exporter TauE/SafE family protein [Caldilineaceae bacterium]|nr:sulfite exporter TauE/SafE family protein [Caldilineaceae bacterium]
MGQMVETTTATSQTAALSREQMKTGNEVARSAIFLHALAFVFGFGLIFTLLGSAAGLLGQNLITILPVIQKTGAILLLIFGLTTMGVFKYFARFITARANLGGNPALALLVRLFDFFNTLLYTERRVTDMHNVNRGWGYMSSIFMGVSFSAGWVPCVGPILASILFLASNGTTATQGAILLAIYSVGLGIPFLITGAAFSSATKTLRKLNRHANIVSIISGIFLLYVAKLLWFDQLALLTTQFTFLNEWVVLLEDQVSAIFGLGSLGIDHVNVLSAAPLALIAGLISFISPCVLPLVPAYIGYLSGASLNSQ